LAIFEKTTGMIVVTGGTGLLGGHLLLELARQDIPVRVLIRRGSDRSKVLSVWKHYRSDAHTLVDRFEWYTLDLANKSELENALEGADQIYHCAGMVSFSNRSRRALWDSNAGITAALVNACLNLPEVKLVHVSSVSAVKAADDGMSSSELSGWPSPGLSMYSRSKTRGELEVWRGIAEGLNAVIVNPSVILGPGDWKNSSSRIFDIVYHRLRYYTLGITGFVDARDVAGAMILLMNRAVSGERYILNAANLNFKQLVEKMAAALDVPAPQYYASPQMMSWAWRAEAIRSLLLGKEPRITRVSAKSAHTKQEYSAAKFCSQMNFSFRDIDETIHEVAAFYLKEKLRK
jgi:dihydroflavonol-4-reductase